MLRPANPVESPALIQLGMKTGVFRAGEAEALLGGVLEEFHAGRLGDGHRVEVWAEAAGEEPEGWVYFAPAPFAEGVWDLWWIGISTARQGRGIGGELIGSVEAQVRQAGGRILIVETSSLPALAPARRFYGRRGYSECGVIPDFYADGEDKVIFSKRIDKV